MREIRTPGVGRGNDRKTGARVVDCSCDSGHRHESGKQNAHSVAVVHPVFLPGGDGQHLSVSGIARLSLSQQPGKIDADLHAVPDWSNPVAGGAAQGWPAPADPGSSAVDRGGGVQLAGDTRRMDQYLSPIENIL